MIWNRQRYLAHCQYEFTGREMFCELFGSLLQLEEEWQPMVVQINRQLLTTA